MSRTVAVVGGGFCGALSAVHLLRGAQPGLRVVLINQSGDMARGLAYGTRSDLHVLNVPAGNMSALADDPQHFLRYCRKLRPSTAPSDFVARSTYGGYLEALLAEEEARATPRAVLERRVDTVLELRPGVGGAWLRLRAGGQLWVDQVVLAFGHFPPADPQALDAQVRATGRYVRDPWADAALRSIGVDEPVAVLGSGLTALDTLVSLRQRGHRGEILCLSRRGLRPQSHRAHGPASPWGGAQALLPALQGGARPALRALRVAVAEAVGEGLDWRDVLAALRAHTPSIWHAWPVAERRRFLRHLQAYWDVHRHRCAPLAGQALAALVETGEARLQAGRLIRVEPYAQGLRLFWRARGGQRLHERDVAWLVNCSGPDCRLQRADSPLIADLLRQGLLCPDELGLGLRVAEDYAVIATDGQASPTLRYVGPLLKARDWEATAVPELRAHARDAAAQVLLALARSI